MKTAKTSQMSPLVRQDKRMAMGQKKQDPCKKIPGSFPQGQKAK